MTTIIVVTGLHQLPPSERWPKLIAPLSDELTSSGLGRILDIDDLSDQFNETQQIDSEEFAVELHNIHYGRDLVNRMINAAGVERHKPEMPKRWLHFHCEDYFASDFAQTGYWDENGQVWLIDPADAVIENGEAEFLQVGRPGVDGIGFGYRKNHRGVWAYYPMEREFRLLAPTIGELLDGWLSGKIAV